MPIVDVQVVFAVVEPGDGLAREIADALGEAFGSAPGRTWVRLQGLDARRYAENRATVAPAELPVFVTVLHAHPPEGAARAEEAAAITQAVARAVGRDPERVHVQYAPAAAGRQAFGGRLVE